MPGHFFPAPKEICSLDLCDTEIAIYSYLMSIEDRKTYRAVASYATIGRALKLSDNTVRKYVLQLEEKNLIYTEHTRVQTRDGRIHNGCMLYTIRPIRDAVEYHTGQQFVRLDAERVAQQARQRMEEYKRRHPQEPLCAAFADEVR
ncbi:MAG: helix-turn-helix domain-containing protein [Oscillospiraceae bacterium]|nr:helix-turn-helix domain-containing protein [Oscillospiraceae bacterium]